MMMDRLDDIRARVAKASDGPWENDGDSEDNRGGLINKDYSLTVGDGCMAACAKMSFADAEFAAHAREDIPWLIAEVKRLRMALEKAFEAMR